MTTRIDHIVVRVADLDQAIQQYEQQGFSVVRGGQHPDFGTHNALIALADESYIELLAELADSEPPPATNAAARRFASWRNSDDGPVDWALLPSDIESAVAGARAAGLTIEGPLTGSRRRPDGVEVAWQFAFPQQAGLPFLCADVTPRDWRVPHGTARQHANGARGIQSILVESRTPRDLALQLGRLAASPPVAGQSAFIVRIGSTEVQIVPGDRDRLVEVRLDGPSPLTLR